MHKYQDILDNDEHLRILGWEKVYHKAIHFPEQILQGNQIRLKFSNIISNQKKIHIWTGGGENTLLIQLLQEIYRVKINIIGLDEIPVKWTDEKGWLIIPDYWNQAKCIPDAQGLLVLANKDPDRDFLQTIYYSIKDISANEGLGIFIGLLCRFLDDAYNYDPGMLINKIVPFIMQKAGAIAWQCPLQSNFAKNQAVRLLDADHWQIKNSEADFQVIATYWQKKLEDYAGLKSGSGNTICLSRMLPQVLLPIIQVCSETIYADGDDPVCEILSLYYLVNIMAIYVAIIKQKKYKGDFYEL